MGVSKTEHFTEKQNDLAKLAKALAHPARIAILDYLASVDTCICGDIVKEIQLAQPTVSQHLKELKNAGLIKGSIDGNSICYCIDEKALENLSNYLEKLSQSVLQRNSCC